MEDVSVSVEQLKSVYKAQTEAYLEFNTALISLLSNQKEILSKVESLKLFSEDELRKLNAEYHALEKLFINFQNTQISRDQEIEGSIDDFKATITGFHEDINSITNDIKSVKSNQWEFKNSINKAIWSVGGIILFLTFYQLVTGNGIIALFK